MRFYKKSKTPFISDGIEVQEDSVKSEGNNPKTETAIVKSILLERLHHRLGGIDALIQKADFETANRISRDLSDEIAVLKEEIKLLNSLPDVLYAVHRANSKVIEIKGLDGSAFELSLSRSVIGGSVYQLKDTISGQTVEIISSDYLDEVEKTCINGYLLPDEKLSQALSQLRKS